MLTNWFTFLLYKFLKVGGPRGAPGGGGRPGVTGGLSAETPRGQDLGRTPPGSRLSLRFFPAPPGGRPVLTQPPGSDVGPAAARDGAGACVQAPVGLTQCPWPRPEVGGSSRAGACVWASLRRRLGAVGLVGPAVRRRAAAWASTVVAQTVPSRAGRAPTPRQTPGSQAVLRTGTACRPARRGSRRTLSGP